MIDIRAERQMLEKSFEVLLQSKSEAKSMLQEMISLAVDSPLELTPIAKGGQTLLGFGVDASKVMDILRQLSDISMGNQQRFESLALAYAQVQAAGRLMGQDLLQLVNAGFNPLKIISGQTGKSMAVLKKEMEEGKISAEMVAGAFAKATSEGGQFYNMTQMQAEGIQGVKSTYHDAIVTMYNDWGQRNEELIISGYKMATEVVKNYEPIIKTLGTIVATYGTYKAALIATHAIEQAQTTTRYKMEIEELTKLLPQKQAAADADLQAAVASGRLTQAKAEELAAVRTEVVAKLEELRDKPSVTKDGVKINLYINVGLAFDLDYIASTNCDGVGLYRTEIPFMASEAMPDVDRQQVYYQELMDKAEDRKVIFRSLDVGSDKLLPYWTNSGEDNPAIGWRSIRITLDRRAILRKQVRAFLRAAAGKELNVMFPMISNLNEFEEAKETFMIELEK